jgi:hypothetical protein
MKLSDWLFAPGGKVLGGIVLGVLLDDGAIFFFGVVGGSVTGVVAFGKK